jgi:CRISPR/Cas system-associated endoribonuclease Cas2
LCLPFTLIDERRKRRLFQNRASALKCRRKKKEQYSNMECEVTKANSKIDCLLESYARVSYENSEKDKIIHFLLHKVAICESSHTGKTLDCKLDNLCLYRLSEYNRNFRF